MILCLRNHEHPRDLRLSHLFFRIHKLLSFRLSVPQLSGAITIAILMLCFQMIKWARKSMQKHLIADASDFTTGGVDIQG